MSKRLFIKSLLWEIPSNIITAGIPSAILIKFESIAGAAISLTAIILVKTILLEKYLEMWKRINWGKEVNRDDKNKQYKRRKARKIR